MVRAGHARWQCCPRVRAPAGVAPRAVRAARRPAPVRYDPPMYVVILAGGGGTRLWPLSRPDTPKPFLPLLGEQSLLQRTVARVVGHPELPMSESDITVVTDRRHWGLVREQAPGIRVIAEPAGRNTAAAIALAAILVDRPDDEVMLVLPADQTIADESRFRSVIASAADLAAGAFDIEDPLVTLGIRIDRPATEYGYLIPDLAGRQLIHGLWASPLRAFEEKPSRERAIALSGERDVFWNAGIFLWRRRAIRDALERYTGLTTLLGPVVVDRDRAELVIRGGESPGRHGGDGGRLGRPRQLDGAPRRHRRRRDRQRDPGE